MKNILVKIIVIVFAIAFIYVSIKHPEYVEEDEIFTYNEIEEEYNEYEDK